MGRPSKYPRELRERAVRMVAEVRPDYPSEYAAMIAVAQMLGIGSPETIRTWIRRDQVEVATASWVQSFNTERTHGSIDDLTSLEAERLDYALPEPLERAG